MAIRLNPEQMVSLAEYIRAKRDEIVGLVNEMDSHIDSETADWEGQARDAYLETYKEILPVLNSEESESSFPVVIEAMAQRLQAAAMTIEEADRSAGDALRGR